MWKKMKIVEGSWSFVAAIINNDSRIYWALSMKKLETDFRIFCNSFRD
jgi:hypothetical protein